MSVINTMLNGLEKRGAKLAAEEVRSVHVDRRFLWFKWLLLPVMLLAAALLVWRMGSMTHKPETEGRVSRAAIIKEGAAPVAAAPVLAASAVIMPSAEKIVAIEPHVISVEKAKVDVVVVPATRSRERVALTREQPVLHQPDATLPEVPVSDIPHNQTIAKPVTPKPAPLLRPAPLVPAQPIKQISLAQQVNGEYRKALGLMEQGNNTEARAGFEAVLRMDAGHLAARRSLVSLLVEGQQSREAEQVLQDGLNIDLKNSSFAMMLARLQTQRKDVAGAIATLEVTLPFASRQADYQAFYAALLQRVNRHAEAVARYQIALDIVPGNGVWLMGYGISLQTLSRTDEARIAYQRALDSKTLSIDLQTFVQQKLKSL